MFRFSGIKLAVPVLLLSLVSQRLSLPQASLAVTPATLAPASAVISDKPGDPPAKKAGSSVTGDVIPAFHLRDGKPFQVLINIKDCDDSNQTDFEKLTVATLDGSGLQIQGKPTFASCGLVATLAADPSTAPGKLPLFLKDSATNTTKGKAFIQIFDAVPGPVPPGISPQVDVLWNVLDGHITEDTFGGWVNKRYYAVEVIIGNNSGFQLQIASVGFNLRDFSGKITPLTDNSDQLAQWRHAPTNDYHVVRATPEKEQIAGPRAYVINTAEAVALLGTGVTPFFKNVRHQATYSTAVTLFGNPVSKGISLIWPDLTVPELNRLDNLALHDNAIVPNNTQTRTIVFIDRHLLSAYFARQRTDHTKYGKGQTTEAKRGTPAMDQAGAQSSFNANPQIGQAGPCEGAVGPQRYWLKKADRTDKHSTRPLCNSVEPQDVKYWLGDLILVGDEIEYRQRIYLGTDQSKTSSGKLTIAPPSVVDTVLANLGAKITLTLPNGDLSALPTGQVAANSQLKLVLDAAGSDKTIRTGILTSNPAGALLTAGAYALSISIGGVDQVVNITVEKQQLTVSPPSLKLSDLKVPDGAPVTITTVGGDLSKFAIDTASLPPGVTADPAAPTPDGKNPVTSFKFILKATAATPAILSTVELIDKQTKGKTIAITP